MKTPLLVAVLFCLGLATVCFADNSQDIWTKQCVKCHGTDGKGQTPMGKKLHLLDFTDAKVKAELKDEEMFKAIKEGRKTKEGNSLMKPAQDATDEDITALVKLIRGLN